MVSPSPRHQSVLGLPTWNRLALSRRKRKPDWSKGVATDTEWCAQMHKLPSFNASWTGLATTCHATCHILGNQQGLHLHPRTRFSCSRFVHVVVGHDQRATYHALAQTNLRGLSKTIHREGKPQPEFQVCLPANDSTSRFPRAGPFQAFQEDWFLPWFLLGLVGHDTIRTYTAHTIGYLVVDLSLYAEGGILVFHNHSHLIAVER